MRRSQVGAGSCWLRHGWHCWQPRMHTLTPSKAGGLTRCLCGLCCRRRCSSRAAATGFSLRPCAMRCSKGPGSQVLVAGQPDMQLAGTPCGRGGWEWGRLTGGQYTVASTCPCCVFHRPRWRSALLSSLQLVQYAALFCEGAFLLPACHAAIFHFSWLGCGCCAGAFFSAWACAALAACSACCS